MADGELYDEKGRVSGYRTGFVVQIRNGHCDACGRSYHYCKAHRDECPRYTAAQSSDDSAAPTEETS